MSTGSSGRRRGPGSRADEFHPTRRDLLEAAFVVAERSDLGSLSVDDVISEAGLAKGTFYVHFGSRVEFLVELHRQFHDRVFGDVLASTQHLEPGSERLAARLQAFLDACLDRPGTRAMLLRGHREPAIGHEVQARNEQAAALIAADLEAMRVDHPIESGRLLVAAVVETARLEREAAHRIAALRSALLRMAAGR